MGLPKKLTDQQMKFAYELVTNEGRKTAMRCYRRWLAKTQPDHMQVNKNPKLYPLVVKYIEST